MLAKSRRLNLRRDFKTISAGRRIDSKYFQLRFVYRSNVDPLVGIATSAKVFKKAHDRNRARRLASKAVEQIYQSLPKALNLVIMPKAIILDQNPDILAKEIAKIF